MYSGALSERWLDDAIHTIKKNKCFNIDPWQIDRDVLDLSFFVHQPPALFLDTAFGCLNDKQLNALLKLGIAHDIGLTLIVVQCELIFRFGGMNPLSAATAG